MGLKPIYGYIALRASDPEVSKAGSAYDPVNRPENTWSDEPWVVNIAFAIWSRDIESEWKKLLKQHRVGTGGTEIFRTEPIWKYAMQSMENFRAQRRLPPQISLGEPTVIPRVELGEVESATGSPVVRLDSVQYHGVAEVNQPKSPYQMVGQKR